MARYTKSEVGELRMARMTRWLWISRAMIPVGTLLLMFVDVVPVAMGAPGYVRPALAPILRELFGGYIFAVFALLCAGPFVYALWKGVSLVRVRVGLTAVWTLSAWYPAIALTTLLPASVKIPAVMSDYSWRAGVLPGVVAFAIWAALVRPLTRKILKGMGFFDRVKPVRIAVKSPAIPAPR